MGLKIVLQKTHSDFATKLRQSHEQLIALDKEKERLRIEDPNKLFHTNKHWRVEYARRLTYMKNEIKNVQKCMALINRNDVKRDH